MASQTKVLLFRLKSNTCPPKFWVGYTTGSTSDHHADNKKNS